MLSNGVNMNLNEAKEILNDNGYRLLKEDVSVWPPDGPDLPIDEWDEEGQQEVNELIQSDAEELEKNIKKEYPDAEVYAWEAIPNDDYEYYGGEYRKKYTCRIELSVPPEVLGLTIESAKGEEHQYIYSLTKEADNRLADLYEKFYNITDFNMDYDEYYDSFIEKDENLCRLQMQGYYEYIR